MKKLILLLVVVCGGICLGQKNNAELKLAQNCAFNKKHTQAIDETQQAQILQAIATCDLDKLSALLNSGLDVNFTKKDIKGHIAWTPLQRAVAMQDPSSVKLLLQSRAKPNFRGDPPTDSPLQIAAWNGNVPIIRELLDAGADVNAQGRDGETSLMSAAWEGKLDALKALLDAGANPNSTNPHGATPLMYAAWELRIDVVEALLKRGADPCAKDKDGDRATKYATIRHEKAAEERVLSNLSAKPCSNALAQAH